MYSKVTESLKFVFENDQLGEKLKEFSLQARTGYWKIKLSSENHFWYLSLAQGRVIFSGLETISWPAFRNNLERHLFKLKKPDFQTNINLIEQDSNSEELKQIDVMLSKLEKKGLISREEVLQTSQKSILLDFDHYLWETQGEGEFIADLDLITQAQIPGFKIRDLLARYNQRKLQWKMLKTQIPSLKAIPKINQNAFQKATLTPQQKERIEKLIKSGKNLENIAINIGKDTLEIAQFFAKLSQGGLVSLKVPFEDQTNKGQKRIFVVDDSPVLLQQFQRLVTKYGYKVDTCGNPLNAIESMVNINPDLVFIDINMPGITGFELIKHIRRKSELATLPLVLLTAEKSVSNQWRAQWANCKFLAKPRTREEVQEFQKELQELLLELVPLK